MKHKKILALLLSFVLAFTMLPPPAAFAESETNSETETVAESEISDISAGETKTIEIIPYEITYLKFIPAVSGIYTFTSNSSSDTYGYLCNADKEPITYNDDDGTISNFSITNGLEAGVTYYWGARYYSTSESGSFDVTLVCDEVFCRHKNTTSYEATAATCTEEGYTVGVYCNDCKIWIEGHEVIPPAHTDEDSDVICDVCGNSMSDILAGETKSIEIAGGFVTYLFFVPTVSGTYRFYSTSDSDTYGYLYDADKNRLAYNDDNDDSGNFSITYNLTAGTGYYWGARFYDTSESGSINVTLICDEVFCSHENTTSYEVSAATCTEDGLERKTCTVCSATEEQAIPSLGHDYSEEWTIDNAATCAEEGSKSHHCTRCDSKRDVTAIETTEHSYESVRTEPTCIDKGYTIHICSVCGDNYVSDETAKLGHNMSDFVVIEQPSCTENGIEISECSGCDYYETNRILPIGHNYENAVCTDCGDNRGDYCSCNCHKSDFIGLLWKIVCFFWKLFSMNPVCTCGAAHY